MKYIKLKILPVIFLGVLTSQLATAHSSSTNIVMVYVEASNDSNDFESNMIHFADSVLLSDKFTDIKPAEQEFEKTANRFVSSFVEKDLDLFVSFYKDSVLYRDPFWGSSDNFSVEDIKKMFDSFLDPANGVRFDIMAICTDVENETLMLLLNIISAQGNPSEYAGCMRFENGKIIEQIDYSTYDPKDLLQSPRFLEYFKKESLEVGPKSEGN